MGVGEELQGEGFGVYQARASLTAEEKHTQEERG